MRPTGGREEAAHRLFAAGNAHGPCWRSTPSAKWEFFSPCTQGTALLQSVCACFLIPHVCCIVFQLTHKKQSKLTMSSLKAPPLISPAALSSSGRNGLGLTVPHRAVEEMGGIIEVETERRGHSRDRPPSERQRRRRGLIDRPRPDDLPKLALQNFFDLASASDFNWP